MKNSKQKAASTTRPRIEPGTSGEGEFYHVEIRPRTGFQTFRTQDVGKPGGIERVAGRRRSGRWDTQKWLISKRLAHVEGGRLVADSSAVRDVLDELASAPVQVVGDRFKGKPKRKARETKRPAAVQRRAGDRSVVKAEALALNRS